jgi:arsenate reductase-like glutaredoxin family protein
MTQITIFHDPACDTSRFQATSTVKAQQSAETKKPVSH